MPGLLNNFFNEQVITLTNLSLSSLALALALALDSRLQHCSDFMRQRSRTKYTGTVTEFGPDHGQGTVIIKNKMF